MTFYLNDFDALFAQSEFGTVALLGEIGAEVSVPGIFDNEFYAVEERYGNVSSSQPVFLCATQDVATVVGGERLAVNSTVYKIVDIQADGAGITKLVLQNDA